VDISFEVTDHSVRINVTDKGPGIPLEFQDRIFERFTQSDSSDSRQKGGTGLGLSISKAIVEKHGGEIGFESEYGSGSTFFLTLPVDQGETVNDVRQQQPEPVHKKADIAARNSTILILEDDPGIAKMLAVMLEQDGYDVDIAGTAEEARKLIASKVYDAMTVDVMLPDQDGISLVRELRANEDTKNIQTIVVSAKASETKEEVVASSMGIVDWLEKPVDRDKLARAVRLAVSSGKEASYPRILHVEDDPDLCEVMRVLIGDEMFFDVAATVQDGWNKLHASQYDLVILDPGMPDGNGLDLLETIKETENTQTPVIIYSSDEIDSEVAARVDRALLKSRNSNTELLRIIGNLIKQDQVAINVARKPG